MVLAGAEGVKDSDYIKQAFGPLQVWVQRDGKTAGTEPQWHREKWPSHTAEEMGPKWEVPSGKQKRR